MQILHEFLRLGVDYSTTSLLQRRSSSPPILPPPHNWFQEKMPKSPGRLALELCFGMLAGSKGSNIVVRNLYVAMFQVCFSFALAPFTGRAFLSPWPQWSWLQFKATTPV